MNICHYLAFLGINVCFGLEFKENIQVKDFYISDQIKPTVIASDRQPLSAVLQFLCELF